MEGIWTRWAQHYQQHGLDPTCIRKDGILNPAAFHQAKRRILFVLKDTNDFRAGNDLRVWLQDGPHYMWHTVARWAAGLLNGFLAYTTTDEDEIKRTALRQIAAINLKKADGGATITRQQLLAYVHQDRDLLLEQIEDIKPDLMIACGVNVLTALRGLLDLPDAAQTPAPAPIRDEVRKAWIIPFRHPARARGQASYEQLRELAQMTRSRGA